jgi:hypothetical protein
MQLPVGYDNFGDIIEKKLDLVDKSLFIQEVMNGQSIQAAVIVRPRRFGKTLNLSMLHHFLAAEIDGRPTRDLFEGLKITQHKELCEKHQGKYPVIFVTFKDVKDGHYQGFYNSLCNVMSRLYMQHHYLLSSDKLLPYQKQVFASVLEERASEANIQSSLLNLTHALYLHHGVKPWLLIDEYDSPIQASYIHHYYQQAIDLFRNLFSRVLKTNPYLQRAVITGVLRIAKESLFSGLNNLEVYSMLRSDYGQYFGFTEEEVDTLLQTAQLENQAHEIKAWYNGYQAGNIVLYNPWSLVNCIKRKGELMPYWNNTSDNQLIKTILIQSSADFKADFETLLQNKSVEHLLDEHTVFGDLHKGSAAWSLLFMAGYLKVISQENTVRGLLCQLTIPNQEVRNLYQQIIEQWLANGHGIEWYNGFINHLLEGNIEAFERDLKHIMEQTVSSHDTSHDPEAFYHGLMVGLTASLYQNKHYDIQSNRESGYGRYDYMIFSHDRSKPTLLLEFKRVEIVKDTDLLLQKLEQAAQAAVEQISHTHYFAEAKKHGSTHIIQIGLAFCGKRFKLHAAQLKS